MTQAPLSRREDLLELSTAALIALTNPGFVKKAQKDLEAGQIPEISETESGTVLALFSDGNRTALPRDRAIKEADCSCPASGLCRHRVTLVLAYQRVYQAQAGRDLIASGNRVSSGAEQGGAPAENFWSPSAFSDALLEKSLTRSTLAQADRLARARPVATVMGYTAEQPVPSVHLPMCTVRFFSRNSLAAARCDCQAGGACAHIALAVWAFRQAEAAFPEQDTATLEICPPYSPGRQEGGEVSHEESPLETDHTNALRKSIYGWLYQIWNEGSSQDLAVLGMGFSPLRQQCAARGWVWVSEALENIWAQLQAQHARSSRFSPRQLLEEMARLWGRLHMIDHLPTPFPLPPRQILGVGIKGELALDHVCLVCLGLAGWRDDAGEGIDLVFADPDTQTVMLLQRFWAQDPHFAANEKKLGNRRIAGYSLAKLATSQIVTKAARRRANAQVDLAANSRQTSLFPLSPKSWDELGSPVRLKRIDKLAEQLRQQLPDFAAPVQALRNFRILAFADPVVDAWGWDAASQTLHAVLCSAAESQSLILQLPYHPHAVDVAARVLKGEWGCITNVAGVVWLAHGQLFMRPWAMMTEERAVILEAENSSPVTPQELPPFLFPDAYPGHDQDYTETVENTFSLLIQRLRLGLRHQTYPDHARLVQQAKALAGQGLGSCAAQLERLAEMVADQQEPLLVLSHLSRLTLLLSTLVMGATP